MKLTRDYHIHSKYSKNGHCHNEIEEIVKFAIQKGLKEIAISDHGIKHIMFGTNEQNLASARKEIDLLNNKYKDIKIKLGIEANLIGFDGKTDISEEVIRNCDVIQMGIHYGVFFGNLKDTFVFLVLNFLSKWFPTIRSRMVTKNTNAMIQAMQRYKIDIITHPGDKIPVDISRLAQEAAKHNTKLEINNSHSHLNVEEIKIASKHPVLFVIGSDAHNYENIGEFSRSLGRIVLSGVELDRVINLEG